MEDMCRTLASFEAVALLDPRAVEELVEDLVRALEPLGFAAERRAEGFALYPYGLRPFTHLRIAVHGEMVSMYVRDPFELEESAESVGVEPEEFYEFILSAIREAAAVFSSFRGRGFIRVRVP